MTFAKSRRLGLAGGALCALAVIAMAAEAVAQTPPAGVLRCDVSGGVSFIFGSSRALECVYSPNDGRPPEFYNGRIRKFGVDVGFVRSGVIVWGVVSPGMAGRPGALAGSYGGVSADVAAGAGVGANALIGGNRIMLNPISVQGLTGLNVAAGIAGLDLEYVDRQPYRQPWEAQPGAGNPPSPQQQPNRANQPWEPQPLRPPR